jgi:DNA-binding Lrp family transcriptional regulator
LQELPVDLDDTDIAILKSLMEDGRKSFRAVSREIKVSTPTVKSRYERLVNIGLIKSVKPEIDLSKVETLPCKIREHEGKDAM